MAVVGWHELIVIFFRVLVSWMYHCRKIPCIYIYSIVCNECYFINFSNLLVFLVLWIQGLLLLLGMLIILWGPLRWMAIPCLEALSSVSCFDYIFNPLQCQGYRYMYREDMNLALDFYELFPSEFLPIVTCTIVLPKLFVCYQIFVSNIFNRTLDFLLDGSFACCRLPIVAALQRLQLLV